MRTERVNIRLTQQERDKLISNAKANDMTITEYIVFLLNSAKFGIEGAL